MQESLPAKSELLPFIVCSICTGVYRDAHTINECMCTFCKCCITGYFEENNATKCPTCQTELGGRPLDTIVADHTMQSIVDWLLPEFKERAEKRKKSSTTADSEPQAP